MLLNSAAGLAEVVLGVGVIVIRVVSVVSVLSVVTRSVEANAHHVILFLGGANRFQVGFRLQQSSGGFL